MEGRFANGEIYVRPAESVRGADCYVIQSHCDPINDHIMEQLITIDALRRASAMSWFTRASRAARWSRQSSH